MPVFDNTQWYKRKIATRYRGGITYLELCIVLVINGICLFFIGFWPPILPLAYFGGSLAIAWRTRRIKTQGRQLKSWIVDMFKFYVKRHPARAHRQVNGLPYTLPPRQIGNLFLKLPRERGRK